MWNCYCLHKGEFSLNELEFWLISIVEDDPLPDEIKYITFFYNENGKMFSLSMGGNELYFKNNYNFDYFPLEAQFCYDKEMMNISDESFFVKMAIKKIDESFYNKELKKNFLNRKIYFAKYGQTPKFLFKINKSDLN